MLYWLTTLQQKRRKFSSKRKKMLVDNTPEKVRVRRMEWIGVGTVYVYLEIFEYGCKLHVLVLSTYLR